MNQYTISRDSQRISEKCKQIFKKEEKMITLPQESFQRVHQQGLFHKDCCQKHHCSNAINKYTQAEITAILFDCLFLYQGVHTKVITADKNLRTYNTLRLGSVVSSLGIEPVSSLSFNRLQSQHEKDSIFITSHQISIKKCQIH